MAQSCAKFGNDINRIRFENIKMVAMYSFLLLSLLQTAVIGQTTTSPTTEITNDIPFSSSLQTSDVIDETDAPLQVNTVTEEVTFISQAAVTESISPTQDLSASSHISSALKVTDSEEISHSSKETAISKETGIPQTMHITPKIQPTVDSINSDSSHEARNIDSSQHSVTPQRGRTVINTPSNVQPVMKLLELDNSSLKAEIQSEDVSDDIDENQSDSSENSKVPENNSTTLRKTPFKGVSPETAGKSKSQSMDDSANSSPLDNGVIVGISVAVAVACIIGFILLNRLRKKSEDIETRSSTISDATNMFASRNTVSHISQNNAAILENHSDNPINYGSVNADLKNAANNHVSKFDSFQTPPISYPNSESDYLDVEFEEVQSGTTSVSYIQQPETIQYEQNHQFIHSINHFVSNSSHSMFLQEPSLGTNENAISDDATIRESGAYEGGQIPFGTSASAIIKGTNNVNGTYVMPESSIITSMNHGSLQNTQIHEQTISSKNLTEQPKRTAELENANSFDSMF